MPILDTLTRDLDWREGEIASLRLTLQSSSISPIQRRTLLRAAWALLYAHYEGFCKNALTVFYDCVANSGISCRSLPNATRLLALQKSINKMRTKDIGHLYDEVINFDATYLQSPPVFPEVDTDSNLWPSKLIELLEQADLSTCKVSEHQIKLRTLVARRNKIAHGERNIIDEVEYYLSYENAVYEVLYDLAYQIDNRLSYPPYGNIEQSAQPNVLGTGQA